jgi:hypothetical protein
MNAKSLLVAIAIIAAVGVITAVVGFATVSTPVIAQNLTDGGAAAGNLTGGNLTAGNLTAGG